MTNKKTLEANIYALKNLWLRIESYDQNLPLRSEEVIIEMMSSIKLLPLAFNKCFPDFCRITINKKVLNGQNTRITETKWLGCKPADKVDSYGRMNLKGQSMLYGTFSVPTAINELQPELGDLVTLSEWTLIQPNTELIVYPVFWNMREDQSYYQILNLYRNYVSQYDTKLQDNFNTQMEFIANVMSKRIERKNNSLYVLTSSIANRILNIESNGETEAILYPSVKDTCKMDNIAIKPKSFNEKYTLKSVREYQIQVNDDELKMNLITGESSMFNQGEIIWQN